MWGVLSCGQAFQMFAEPQAKVGDRIFDMNCGGYDTVVRIQKTEPLAHKRARTLAEVTS